MNEFKLTRPIQLSINSLNQTIKLTPQSNYVKSISFHSNQLLVRSVRTIFISSYPDISDFLAKLKRFSEN